MIKISGLTKRVQSTTLLNSVNLEMESGKILGVIGPSGNGKTTLLMCLSGLLPFEEGSITVNNHTIQASESENLSEKLWQFRRQSGIVFQHLYLFPHLTVVQNITEAPVHVLGKVKKEAEAEARDYLRSLGLEQHGHKYPDELSGGEQQRVAILRALAMKPDVLLLDEPTSALDPERSADVRTLLQDYVGQGHTIVIVSHSIRFLKGTADYLAYMGKTEIIEMNETKVLLENPSDERTRQFLSHSEEN